MLAEADECTRKIAKQLKDMNLAAQDADALQAHHKAIEVIELERQLTEQKLQQDQEAAAKAHAEQLAFEKQKMKLEMEHQQQILSLKEDNASASQNEGAAVRITKVPKLVISKFDGTPQDCVRFWGQFSSQIDCAKEPAITNFRI